MGIQLPISRYHLSVGFKKVSTLHFSNTSHAEHGRSLLLCTQPSTGETQKSMNNVNCRRDMTEILLKAA